MNTKLGLLVLTIFFSFYSKGQELYPNTESASNVPKGIVGVRLTYDRYKEQSSNRIKEAYHARIMYGITPKWTIMSTIGVSNHHYNKFPTDILQYFFNHHLRSYPAAGFGIEGVNLYSKYRFLTRDGYHTHFRMAVFAEGCKSFIAHDNAEPTLLTDNSGYGGGIIATYLYEKFAITFTGGFIKPLMFIQRDIDIRFKSGNAVYAELSLGYRLFPIHYASYSDININIYSEFKIKQYGAAYVEQYGKEIDVSLYAANNPYAYKELAGSYFVDGHFSVQFISNSNSRLDVGVTLALKNRSYIYWSPMFTLQYQTYLYKPKKKKNLKFQNGLN
ncbi:hypothetical protein [uncultured Cytophaga sp.]|uniref:hypothetical protein n=1 Tax=uncultured Cytophaga sp. TaxID=160238 RepID=UPI0026313B3F|nr:hypothetical protein [uncultured Cytophaga sp.]